MLPARSLIILNLRTVILLLALILFTTANISAHLFIKNALVSSLDRELEKSNRAQAEVVLSRFNTEVEKHLADLTSLQNYFITNQTIEPENLKNYAQSLITSKSIFNQIGLVDLNFSPIVSTESSIPNKSFIQDFLPIPEIQEVIKANYIYKEQFLAGPIDLPSKRTLLVMFHPTEINGVIGGLAFGVVDINRLSRNVFSTTAADKFNVSVDVNNKSLIPYDASQAQSIHQITIPSSFGKSEFKLTFYPKNFITESGQIAIQIVYASIIAIQTLAVAILIIFMSQTHELEKRVFERTAEILQKNKLITIEQEKIKKIIDNTPVGIVLATAPDLKPIFYNQKITDFLGPDLDNVTSLPQIISSLKPTDKNNQTFDLRLLPFNQSVHTNRTETTEDLLIDINGQKKQIKMVSIPIHHEDGKTELLVVVTDLTEEAKLAENLKRVNQELLSMDKQKDEFLSVTSHELRTPMTAIKGYVDMILNGDAGTINDEIKNYLTEVYKSVNRLTDLVNNILTVSKLQNRATQFNLKPINITAFIQSNINSWQALLGTKQIVLSFTPAIQVPPVLADSEKLLEILNNFVGNAIKYTEKGSVTISTSFDSNYVYVSISDTGIGISPDDTHKIFRRFYRVDNSRSRNQEGSGLGLYIAKDLVEKMHGQVFVKSALGSGSTFSFSIPISKPDKTPLSRDTQYVS